MFARNVTLKLKPNCAIEFSRVYEQDILPVLRQQPGFRDGMTLVSGERREAVVISVWETREGAEAFSQTTYASLLERLTDVLAEPPLVSTLVVSNSTQHQLAARR